MSPIEITKVQPFGSFTDRSDKKNSKISGWDSGHDWRRSQQVNQIHSQGYGSIWVSYEAGRSIKTLNISIQDENGAIFLTGHERQEENHTTKLFNKVKHPLQPNVGFSQVRKILAWIKWWNYRIAVDLFCRHEMYWFWWKPNTQSSSWCLGDHWRWWRYASIHPRTLSKTQHRGLHQVPREGCAALDWEGGCWKDLLLTKELCAMPHKQKLVLTVRIFLRSHLH